MLIVLFFYLAIVVILDQSVSLAHADNWNINVSMCREKQSLKHLPLCIAFYPTNQSVFTSLRLSSPIIIQSLFYEWKMEIKFVWDFGMRKSSGGKNTVANWQTEPSCCYWSSKPYLWFIDPLCAPTTLYISPNEETALLTLASYRKKCWITRCNSSLVLNHIQPLFSPLKLSQHTAYIKFGTQYAT